VTAQFAILIALLIATAIVWQQRVFASGEALRAEVDRVVVVTGACPPAFVAEARKLPGVEAVGCSGHELLAGETFAFVDVKGAKVSTDVVRVLPAVFAVYGIRPVAGSFAAIPRDGEEPARHAVINEAAVERFGLGTPDRAIGKAIPVPGLGDGPEPPAQVVAVVPDFAFYPVTRAIQPTVYLDSLVKEGPNGLISIRLGASQMKETLRAIDGLWRSTGQAGPIDRAFVSDRVAEQYRDLERGTQLFAIFAAIAAALSCLGLVGLSIAAAERRTKEIGIRKVLGARTGQILALLLAQLTRPVLWANLIAWPAAWWAMREWLNGFAYRVPIDWRLFPAAGAIALGLAILATGAQAWRAARARPVEALRYE
jgi:putative ABC transport system permease protein